MSDTRLRRKILTDVVFMNYVGMRPVLIHGGGPLINQKLEQKGKQALFSEGLRVTDAETMAIVEEALTQINQEIVQEILDLGAVALSLSGKEDSLIFTKKHEAVNNIDMGYVGEVMGVKTELLARMLTSDIIPVISPVGANDDGAAYNVNADSAAAEIARVLKALKFILITNVDGIFADSSRKESIMPHIRSSQIIELIDKQVIQAGMIPKIRACLRALEDGVQKAHIINGNIEHALLLEIFTKKGIGTEIIL